MPISSPGGDGEVRGAGGACSPGGGGRSPGGGAQQGRSASPLLVLILPPHVHRHYSPQHRSHPNCPRPLHSTTRRKQECQYYEVIAMF